MQYVNDDMDELFKRAAENYPLDTRSADWNKVLAALQNETETKTTSGRKEGKKGRFLWLLLLLPLGLICNRFYSPGSLNEKEISQTSIEKNLPSAKTTTKGNVITNNKVRNTISGDPADAIDNNPEITSSNPKVVTSRKNTVKSGLSLVTRKDSYLSKANNSKTAGNYPAYNNAFSSKKRNQSITNVDFINEEQSSYRNYVSQIAFYKKPLGEFSTSVTRSLNPLLQPPKQDVKQKIQVTRRKKFYAGLVGGVDATTVKFQKIEDAGFNYGLLLGFQFNKKWSIEAGALLERKYYYSDGKYLNTSKMYLPPNTWIEDASGGCKMIEIPIAAKYNFSARKNSSWFGTVGISSYIMQKENYTYNYYYGTTGPVPHKKEYRNASTNLFSALSVSGGYTHRLGNFGDVRIEPYVKLPISKMGVGELPFFSTGLQVGVTRKF